MIFMKKNNNIQQFVIAIVTVVAIIAIVGGSTFAYFQWTTNNQQRTNVNVTIAAGGIKMTITQSDGQLETAGLRPVYDCNNSNSYMDATVVIENTTGTLAVPSFKIKAKVESSGTLTSDILSHIHYAVVPIASIGAAETTTTKCSTPATVENAGILGAPNASTSATGTFADVSTSGAWTDLPPDDLTDSDNPVYYYLSRSYSAGTSNGITFIGKKAGEGTVAGGTVPNTGNFTTAYFRVYVWIDSTYTYTNVGNAVTDPLQDATIWLQWSEKSIVEQVSD